MSPCISLLRFYPHSRVSVHVPFSRIMHVNHTFNANDTV